MTEGWEPSGDDDGLEGRIIYYVHEKSNDSNGKPYENIHAVLVTSRSDDPLFFAQYPERVRNSAYFDNEFKGGFCRDMDFYEALWQCDPLDKIGNYIPAIYAVYFRNRTKQQLHALGVPVQRVAIVSDPYDAVACLDDWVDQHVEVAREAKELYAAVLAKVRATAYELTVYTELSLPEEIRPAS